MLTPAKIAVPSNVEYVKVVVRKKGSPDITPDFGADINIYDYDSPIIRAITSSKSAYNTALLTIIDDDSNARFYNDLYEVFKDKNVPISTAVITGKVGNSGFMTWDQVEECYTNGIEILSHTNSHFLSTDPGFNDLTESEIQKDYQIAQNKLGLHGVNADILVFSGSTGLYTKFQNAAKMVYKGGILAGANETNYQNADPYQIQRYRIGNHTDYHCDLDVLKGLIDDLYASGGWMIWMTHTSGGSDAWTPGTGEGSSAYILGQAADYAIAKGVKMVTAHAGFRKYCEG